MTTKGEETLRRHACAVRAFIVQFFSVRQRSVSWNPPAPFAFIAAPGTILDKIWGRGYLLFHEITKIGIVKAWPARECKLYPWWTPRFISCYVFFLFINGGDGDVGIGIPSQPTPVLIQPEMLRNSVSSKRSSNPYKNEHASTQKTQTIFF